MAEQRVIEEHTEYLTQYKHSMSREIKVVWYGYGSIKPFIGGKGCFLHRDSGPAKTNYFSSGEIESEAYYVNNKPHRIDGPAFIGYNRDGSIHRERYYIFGKVISKDKYYTPGFIDAFIIEHS